MNLKELRKLVLTAKESVEAFPHTDILCVCEECMDLAEDYSHAMRDMHEAFNPQQCLKLLDALEEATATLEKISKAPNEIIGWERRAIVKDARETLASIRSKLGDEQQGRCGGGGGPGGNISGHGDHNATITGVEYMEEE